MLDGLWPVCIMTGMARPITAPARLREWRKGKGWTQVDAAEALGTDQPRWSQYERGDAVPTLRHAFAIEKLTKGEIGADAWV